MDKDQKEKKVKDEEEKKDDVRELTEEELNDVSAGRMSPYVKKKVAETIIKH